MIIPIPNTDMPITFSQLTPNLPNQLIVLSKKFKDDKCLKELGKAIVPLLLVFDFGCSQMIQCDFKHLCKM